MKTIMGEHGDVVDGRTVREVALAELARRD